LSRITFTDVGDCAARFAAWRTVYNTIGPHHLGVLCPTHQQLIRAEPPTH
jgi:hypothetical protein